MKSTTSYQPTLSPNESHHSRERAEGERAEVVRSGAARGGAGRPREVPEPDARVVRYGARLAEARVRVWVRA